MNLINKYLITAACVGAGMLLCSCTFSNHTSGEPDSLTLFCENLKQDIILNDGLNSMNNNGPSPTQAASYYKQYNQNNCDDVIAGRATKMVKPTT